MGCIPSSTSNISTGTSKQSPIDTLFHAIESDLLTKIGELKLGETAMIEGYATSSSDDPITAPISGAPCFYYGVSAKELVWYTYRSDDRFGKGTVDDRERWEVRYSKIVTADFVVTDKHTGERALIKVDPHTYKCNLPARVTNVEVQSGESHPTGLLLQFNPENAEYSMGRWKYEETCYRLEERVAVLGVVAEETTKSGSIVKTLNPVERESLPPALWGSLSPKIKDHWREITRTPVTIISARLHAKQPASTK